MDQENLNPKLALLDLSDREFRAWRHHPVTALVRRFLVDRQEALWADLRQRFKVGSLQDREAQEFRGRMNEIEEFLELQIEDLDGFYGVERKENGTEVSESESGS